MLQSYSKFEDQTSAPSDPKLQKKPGAQPDVGIRGQNKVSMLAKNLVKNLYGDASLAVAPAAKKVEEKVIIAYFITVLMLLLAITCIVV